jgi:hypothetical protein
MIRIQPPENLTRRPLKTFVDRMALSAIRLNQPAGIPNANPLTYLIQASIAHLTTDVNARICSFKQIAGLFASEINSDKLFLILMPG